MKSAAKSAWICLLVLGLIFTPITSAFAQTYTATVTGTVTDPQGAAVAGVKVVATNQGTKLEYTAQTGASGVYTVPFLPVGVYALTVESTGFKKLVSNEIKLEVNQTARIDLQLQVGGVNEVVNVQDVAAVLQTESVTVGNVISGSTTTTLPLNGRNFNQLTLLVPGAVTPNPGSFTTVNPASGGQRPYVNGNREQGNAFLLDGISVDETIDNRIGYKPNVDAIAEFRVETSNSSSEFGNVTGATVNATLKSGTNDFHGNTFEFFRNDALDANEWSANRNGQKKSKLRQNIFGGTLGGPIIKNKFFFFVDYQGTVQRTGGPGTATVAPAAWRTGDLSSLLSGSSGIVRDPTKCTNPRVVTTCEPFPGNKIPIDRIVNPVAKALFADTTLYPLPVRSAAGTGLGLIDVVTASQLDGHQFDIKLDARLSEKDNVTGRYSFANIENADVKGSLPTNITAQGFSRPQNILLNWTRTISPTIINEARVGFNRALFISDFNDWAGVGNANATLGIPGAQAIAGVSSITMGNGVSIGSLAVNEDNVTNTFHYGDNLTILRGRHTLKMGGQLQRYQQNRYYPGNNGLLGGFTYNGTYTGVAFGDFLLDQLQSKSIGSQSGTWGHRQIRLGFFFQDDFKLRNNLTLNLGMRWEYTSPVVEVKDRQSNFDLKTGKQLFAGQDGNGRALYDPYYKGFEPRLGIAWTPERFKNKLVVRAGYGITQFMEGTGSNLRLPLNPPFFVESNVTFTNQSGPGTITQGFTDVVGQTAIQGLIRIWNPKLRPQFTQQYNLTLEYQLSGSTSVSAAYVGHDATHLVAPTDDNQALPDPGPVSTWRPLAQRRPFAASLPLVGGTQSTDSWSISNYNALQLGVRQRQVKGFDYMLSYTLSKTMTDNRGFYGSAGVQAQFAYAYDNYNRRADYGPAFFDALHNFSWAGSYELPFGKGRSFGANLHPAVNAVLGGWNVSSIISAHSGFPITVLSNDVSEQAISRSTATQGRPLLVGDPKPANQTIDNWLNLDAFRQPAQGQLGNAGVGIVRAPGYANLDFGVGKKFSLSETRNFDFRAEFFNFTNHPSFAPPGRSTADLNTFGKITGTISNSRRVEFALKFNF
jgi:carboxypeptidase family protein